MNMSFHSKNYYHKKFLKNTTFKVTSPSGEPTFWAINFPSMNCKKEPTNGNFSRDCPSSNNGYLIVLVFINVTEQLIIKLFS